MNDVFSKNRLIDPSGSGHLILRLDKETYELLGLEGSKSALKSTAREWCAI